MASSTTHDMAPTASEMRQRLPQDPSAPQHAKSVEDARRTVEDLNKAEGSMDKNDKERRTYGRTPDGTVFTVPHTHDMVSQLLSPKQPKNASDLIVLAVLAVHVYGLYILPSFLRIPVFAVVFLFWRSCYNVGIGFLLREQSNNKTLVAWAKHLHLFEKPESGNNPRPILYGWLKREMETKIPKDYNFDEAPLEYNVWLLFRRVVDLILMCDFVSYCLFAIACGERPAGEHVAMTLARWSAGIGLVLFNLWVKLDAHRVVKDFAWYWGDFFFLVDQELTFDGVFEMAPHPMYSVGYAGYYGISMMAASYKVLFISIVAHAAQFAFLTLVENPHIEKTYNPPPPRKRTHSETARDPDLTNLHELDPSIEHPAANHTAGTQPSHIRDLIGPHNVDFHRVTDIFALLLQFYLYSLAFLTPSTIFYQAFFVINAIVWRLWYSLGLGYILDRQSKKKKWTRHFIKYGETTEEAWRQWKSVYHLSMTMCYVSFVTAAFKMYTLPPDWEYGMVLLRHVFGLALISLQLWTIISIYESIGEFGWFFGDFFFEHGPKLTYSGIYRFLNNPERILGLAGVWGFAIITWSKAMFFLALLSHVLTLWFIRFVESPHMQKRYGRSLRQYSGLSKSFQRTVPESIRHWQSNFDKMFNNVADRVEEFIESTRPKIATMAGVLLKKTKHWYRQYPTRMSMTKVSSPLAGFDKNDYSVTFTGTSTSAARDKVSGREGDLARSQSFRGDEFQPQNLEYGAPIKVTWTAPLNHSKKDWIGLYMLGDNRSREITRISSQGRWIATSKDSYDTTRAEQGILVSDKEQVSKDTDVAESNHEHELELPLMTGEMVFEGDKLWWTTGIFEFRYHHDGRHNVIAVSQPFEIRIGRFVEEEVELDGSGSIRTAVEQALLPVVRNCFDRDPEIAPEDVDESFGSRVDRDGKFSKRVVFAVWQMFGIEFAPEVVKADGNVRNLAWRICNAKQVLAPYSLASTRGTTTPTEPKFGQ